MGRKKSEERKYRLSVFLFKEDCAHLKDALKQGLPLAKYRIKGFSADQMVLYVKGSKSFLPKWLSFFDGFLAQEVKNVFNSSSSAVLLVKHDKRVFAFTFGYGRGFLNLNLVEDNFGLKVALNSIDPDKMRSVDIKNLDTVVRQSKVQVSQAGTVDNFGFNIDRDILNAVTGISNEAALGKQISGATSLHLSVAMKIDTLSSLCTLLLKKFGEKIYKEHFAWVDHISEVKNKGLVGELDSLLVKAIVERNFEQLFLAIPEIIDWEQVQGFKYKESDKETIEDIQIEDVLPSDDKIKEKVNLGWLERKSVLCVGSENEQIIYEWSLYDCINYEIKKGKETFLLTSGKWFKIDTKYVETVAGEISHIPEYKNFKLLPSEGEREGDYNKRLADSDKKRCFLMDKKLIPYGGGQNKFEVCDVFVDKRDLIHVKRFRGSACLSHLFQQGHNSAFLLRTEGDFVKKVNKVLPPAWRFDESAPLNTSDYEVVFAIISKVKMKVRDVFPFFSKVSLQQVYKQLKAYGYRVSIAKIEMKTDKEEKQ
jgi:uncharacterized protein (TIGR04141 family)